MNSTHSGSTADRDRRWWGWPKPPCLYPQPNGGRCCECKHCHPTPDDMEAYYGRLRRGEDGL